VARAQQEMLAGHRAKACQAGRTMADGLQQAVAVEQRTAAARGIGNGAAVGGSIMSEETAAGIHGAQDERRAWRASGASRMVAAGGDGKGIASGSNNGGGSGAVHMGDGGGNGAQTEATGGTSRAEGNGGTEVSERAAGGGAGQTTAAGGGSVAGGTRGLAGVWVHGHIRTAGLLRAGRLQVSMMSPAQPVPMSTCTRIYPYPHLPIEHLSR
jgi:hypothetical protein